VGKTILQPLRRPLSIKVLLLTLIALFCSVLFSATCFAQVPDRYVVEITGADTFEKLLNDNLEIKQHQSDSNMTLEEWKRLASITPQKIKDLLQTEGYFSSKVTPEFAQEEDSTIARFNITLGSPVMVASVQINFHGAIAEGTRVDAIRMDILRSQWRLPEGTIFRQQGWVAAKTGLLKSLLIQDFPAAKLTQSEAQIDPEQHKATLLVDVDSGPYFTFGDLQIEGLKRYPRSIVDPLNPIHPGDPFTQDKLNELQARLQDTGYFRSVFATIAVDPQHPDNVPVRVDINENERRRLSLGFGFSTDTGARVQAKWLDRQFFGHNWRTETELRVDRQSAMLGEDLYFPALDNGWRPSLGTHYERTDIANEIDDKIRVDARLTSPLKENEHIWGASYFADRQRAEDVAINHRQAWVATYVYTMRRLDNLLTPQRGHVVSLELDGGITSLAQRGLARYVGRANWIVPLGKTWQVNARAQVGQVLGATREAVPGDLLFRTGGDQSVRGYAYNSLGVTEGQAIVGGTVVGVASAELVYKFTPSWGMALFRDAGNATDSWRGFQFMQGTGIGARWNSPIGAVNLDLAYGHATNEVRLHFTVGYGF
jgi:translocation and assembly module TamA